MCAGVERSALVAQSWEGGMSSDTPSFSQGDVSPAAAAKNEDHDGRGPLACPATGQKHGGTKEANQERRTGFPWWLSSKESACQGRRHGFDPWSRKIPHTSEQLSL